MKDLLLFNMSSYFDWMNSVQNRNFHIYESLKNDKNINKILLVDFLDFSFKQKIKYYYKKKKYYKNLKLLESNKYFNFYKLEENIYLYSFNFLHKHKEIYEHLNVLLKKYDFQNIIEWNYNIISYDYWRNKLENIELKVFDAVDNWLLHFSYKYFNKRLSKNYVNILRDMDLVFTVSKKLKDLFVYWNEEQADNIYYIPNGVSEDLLNHKIIPSIKTNLLEEIKEKYKYILGYIGVIQSDRFDFDLLEYLLKQNPEKAFVIAGPYWKNVRKKINYLKKTYDNVFFIGSVKREEWFTVANYFDLALALHLNNDFMKYISPTKIFEYLASSLAVISTDSESLNELRDKIFIAKNFEEFNILLNKALLNKNIELCKQNELFIKNNFQWKNTYSKMQEKLFNH